MAAVMGAPAEITGGPATGRESSGQSQAGRSPTDRAVTGRAPTDRPRQRLSAPVLLALLSVVLMACCPVPAGTGSDTAFAADLIALTENGATAVLDSGRQLRLTYLAGVPREPLSVGQRVYVEGVLTGEAVAVSRIVVVRLSRAAQPARAATAAAPMTPASVPSSAGRSSGTG